MKIRAILVMSLVALSLSAASAERLFSPMLGEISPPRPPREIGTSTSHQPDLPAAVPVDQPEQKPNAVTAPVNRPEQKPTKQPEHKPSAAASPVKHPEHKPTKQPEQKRAAAPVLGKPDVVTIGHSAAAPRPASTGSTPPPSRRLKPWNNLKLTVLMVRLVLLPGCAAPSSSNRRVDRAERMKSIAHIRMVAPTAHPRRDKYHPAPQCPPALRPRSCHPRRCHHGGHYVSRLISIRNSTRLYCGTSVLRSMFGFFLFNLVQRLHRLFSSRG